MIPVKQEIICREIGDCLKACVSSLFEIPMDAVPNFQLLNFMDKSNWWHSYFYFMLSLGYDLTYVSSDLHRHISTNVGVDGLYIAAVKSQRFKSAYHAIIVDKELNCVHDPNPGNKPPYEVVGLDLVVSKGIFA